MRIRRTIAVAALMFLTGFGTGCAKVEPGWAGIKVNQYGDQKGVEDFPIQTGRVWFNPFTQDVYQYPTFLQNVVWTKDDVEGSRADESITFNSTEGSVVNADIALSYALEREKVPSLFVEFRKDAKNLTDVYMRSQVRNSFQRVASTMPIVRIFGAGKQELLDRVKADVEEELAHRGFRFDMISFVGALRVDDRVLESINATIQATQRAIESENKVRQIEAEKLQTIISSEADAQSILNVANAEAEANRIIAESLSPQLLQWRALEVWDGILPQVTGGAVPFINVSPGTGSTPRRNQ